MIYGIAINDADYVVQPTIKGVRVWCPFYRKWYDMLERCYCPKALSKRPTYKGCIICDDWLIFSNFKEWMGSQDWKGKQLDKDIIGNGSIYSPATCCFVELWLNNLFNAHAVLRGPYPIGVSKFRNKFRAQLRVNKTQTYLGLFDTPKKASQAYQKAKQHYVMRKMKDYPNQRIKQAVLAKVYNDKT